MSVLDLETRNRVKGWPAVAVYVAGWEQVWEPEIYLDENGNEIEGSDGEFVDDVGGRIRVVMVGDDREHLVDLDELEPLDDLDYCAQCGQIGCSHDGREREGGAS